MLAVYDLSSIHFVHRSERRLVMPSTLFLLQFGEPNTRKLHQHCRSKMKFLTVAAFGLALPALAFPVSENPTEDTAKLVERQREGIRCPNLPEGCMRACAWYYNVHVSWCQESKV